MIRFLLNFQQASFFAAALVLAHDSASNFPPASSRAPSSVVEEISIPTIGYANVMANPPLSLRATRRVNALRTVNRSDSTQHWPGGDHATE